MPAEPRCPPDPTAFIDPRLAEGIALFNHHQFFTCHEVLERLWLKTSDHSKDFYKGLIQAAVAFHHWSRGNLAGALTLAHSASRYLKRYRPAFCGIDVEHFLAQFSELFQWLRRHPQRYDPHLVPMIRWANPSTSLRVGPERVKRVERTKPRGSAAT